MIILQENSKKRALIQTDYLAQVLKPAIKGILEDFGLVTAKLRYLLIFIKDSNLAYGHKSVNNPCVLYKKKHRIQFLNHLFISPDLNIIKKY